MILPSFPLQFSHPTRTKYSCLKLLKTDVSFHQAKFYNKYLLNYLFILFWGVLCWIFIALHVLSLVGAAAAAKSRQLCPTLCNPIDGSHQAPPSLGFSRQEHWSGLLFPSPMLESEEWKGSCSVMSDSKWPHGLQPTRLLCPWDFPGKSTGVGCHCLLPSWGRQGLF